MFFSGSGPQNPNQQTFLCLEIAPGYLRATPLKLSEGNHLSLAGETVFRNLADTDSIWPQAELADFIASLHLPKGLKVVLNVHNRLAAAIPAWVIVRRSDPKQEINEGELENITSQAVWKFLHTYKATALESLSSEEADILLGNVRVMGVRINNHKVINPQGFRAKTIEFLIEETFILRPYFRALEELLPDQSEIVFISVAGLVEAEVMFRAGDFTDIFNLLRFLPDRVLPLIASGRPRYQNDISSPILSVGQTLSWHQSDLLRQLTVDLAVNEEVASQFYRLYLTNQLSRSLSSFVGSTIGTTWQDFIDQAVKTIPVARRRYPLRILSEYDLPLSLSRKPASKLSAASYLDAVTGLGFTLDSALSSNPTLSAAVASLVEATFSRSEDRLNQLARRRARWLIT